MTTTNPARRIAAKRAAHNGAAFETRLAARHEVARTARYADVQHIATPTRQIRGELRRVARTGADYLGRWGSRAGNDLIGRLFVMEAKSTGQRKSALPVGANARGLAPHQRAYLVDSWDVWRTPAFLLWLNGDRLGVIAAPALVGCRETVPWAAMVDITDVWDRPFGWLEWAADWVRSNSPATGEEAA